MQIILVMLGGFFGAISRYRMGEWISVDSVRFFPFGTLLVNLLGCFLLGWLLTFMKQRKIARPWVTLFFGTGFIGSFTTFSTFSVETIQLVEKGQVFHGALYVLSSIFLGLLFVFLGSKLATPSKKEGDIL